MVLYITNKEICKVVCVVKSYNKCVFLILTLVTIDVANEIPGFPGTHLLCMNSVDFFPMLMPRKSRVKLFMNCDVSVCASFALYDLFMTHQSLQNAQKELSNSPVFLSAFLIRK